MYVVFNIYEYHSVTVTAPYNIVISAILTLTESDNCCSDLFFTAQKFYYSRIILLMVEMFYRYMSKDQNFRKYLGEKINTTNMRNEKLHTVRIIIYHSRLFDLNIVDGK